MGSHEAGGVPRGWARPGPSWPGVCSPCCVLSVRYSQIFQKKSYLISRAFGELLFSRYFFITWIIQETDRKYYFYFISTKQQKVKGGYRRLCFLTSSISCSSKGIHYQGWSSLVNKLIPNNMEPEKFRITLCYLNGDMHIPNNKNIISLFDSRERKFKTSKNNR